ncbi:MAG: GNAT family N-acetyltransferase [Cyclobacteriaceae bacterium]
MIKISRRHEDVDIDIVHQYLAEQSYWAKSIPRNTVKLSIENSECFTVLLDDGMIGFGRLVTDKATFAYLADVFILEGYQGKGYAKKLIEFILSQSDLQGIRRWMLMTKDAHGLYKQFGFSELEDATMALSMAKKNLYNN